MSATSDELSAGVRNTFAAGGASVRDRQMEVLGNLPFFLAPGRDRRSRVVKDRIDRDLDNLKDASDKFYSAKGDLSKIYERGLLDGGGSRLTRRDTRILKRMRDDGIAEMNKMLTFARRDWRRVNAMIKSTNDPTVLERKINQSGLKGLRYIDGRMVGIKQYSNMAIQTRSAVAYNRGIIEGGIRGGAVSFTISDGSDCGLTRHDDPEKANGMIVSAETALGNIIAHPHCQRTFSPSKKEPPNRAGKSRAKSALATVGRLTRQTVIQSAKAGVAGELSEFLRSPQAARFALRLLPGVNDYQRSLDGLTKLIKRSGQADLTPEQVREDIMAWGEEWLEKGILPSHVAEVIGVKIDAPDIAVNDAFYRFSVFRDMDIKNSMSHGDLGDMLDFQKLLYDTMFDYWAGKVEGALPRSRFGHFSFPRVPTARPETAAEKAIRAKINADRLSRKLKPIRRRLETQSGFVSRGGRLTLNLEQHIRATATYRPGRGFVNHLSLNPNGMIRMGFATNPDTGLLTPSLRLVPPGPIHIGMRLNRSAGRLVRWVNITDEDIAFSNSADMRKARAAQARLNLMRDRGVLNIRDFQQELNDTIIRIDKGKITSVTAEVRLVTPDWKMGGVLDKLDVPGYPGKVLARSRMGLDFSSQLNLDLRKLGLRGLGDIKDLTPARFKELGLADLKVVSLAAEYMASGGSPWDLSHIFRIGVDRDVRTFWALINKYVDDQAALGRGSWADFKANRARRRFIKLEGEGLGGPAIDPPPDPPFRLFAKPQSSSLDPDVRRRVQDLSKPSKLEEFGGAHPEKLNNPYLFLSDSLEEAFVDGRMPESLLDDLERAIVMHDNMFPKMQNGMSRPLNFFIGNEDDADWLDGSYAYFQQSRNAIFINPKVAANWGTDAMKAVYQADKAGGWSQPDKGEMADLIVHEMGHWLTSYMSDFDHIQLFRIISEEYPFDFVSGAKNASGDLLTLSEQVGLFPGNRRVKNEIGKYATQNWLEFIAEAWADYATSAEPSDLSKLVGGTLEKIIKGGAKQENGLDFGSIFKIDDDGVLRMLPKPGGSVPIPGETPGGLLGNSKTFDHLLDPIYNEEGFPKQFTRVSGKSAFDSKDVIQHDAEGRRLRKKELRDRLTVALERFEADNPEYGQALEEEFDKFWEKMAPGRRHFFINSYDGDIEDIQDLTDIQVEKFVNWDDNSFRGYLLDGYSKKFKGIGNTNQIMQAESNLLADDSEDLLGRWWARNKLSDEQKEKLELRYPDFQNIKPGDLTSLGYSPEKAYRQIRIEQMIDSWMYASNETAHARYMQEIARKEFDLDGTSLYHYEVDNPLHEVLNDYLYTALEDYDPERAALYLNTGAADDLEASTRAVFRSMYEETQRRLEADGIDEVTLYRGVVMKNGKVKDLGQVQIDETGQAWVEMTGSPLASWSVGPETAQQFATSGFEGNYGYGPGDLGRAIRDLEDFNYTLEGIDGIVGDLDEGEAFKDHVIFLSGYGDEFDAFEKTVDQLEEIRKVIEGKLLEGEKGLDKMASEYQGSHLPFVMTITVPRWRIISTARTGMGSLMEGELVVFTDRMPARVRWSKPFYDKTLGTNHEFYESP